MTKRITTLDFKTVEPFFSQERDGIKPFTERLVDPNDTRFHIIAQWWRWIDNPHTIRITNPATGETFSRQLIRMTTICLRPAWIILYLGKKL